MTGPGPWPLAAERVVQAAKFLGYEVRERGSELQIVVPGAAGTRVTFDRTAPGRGLFVQRLGWWEVVDAVRQLLLLGGLFATGFVPAARNAGFLVSGMYLLLLVQTFHGMRAAEAARVALLGLLWTYPEGAVALSAPRRSA